MHLERAAAFEERFGTVRGAVSEPASDRRALQRHVLDDLVPERAASRSARRARPPTRSPPKPIQAGFGSPTASSFRRAPRPSRTGSRRLGWKPDHFLFMVYRGGGAADTARVEEVGPRLRRLRDDHRANGSRTPTRRPSRMNAADVLQVKAANARTFGIVEDGEVVSSAQSVRTAGTGEDVATLPGLARGRGQPEGVSYARGRRKPSQATTSSSSWSPTGTTGQRSSPDNRVGFEEVGSRFAFLSAASAACRAPSRSSCFRRQDRLEEVAVASRSGQDVVHL